MATSTPMSELLARARAAAALRKLHENQYKEGTQNEHIRIQVNEGKSITGVLQDAISTDKAGAESAELPSEHSTEGSGSSGSPIAQFSGEIELNAEQQAFKDLVLSGKDCVLIGAAGTGKTTCLKAVIQALAHQPTSSPLQGAHKYLVAGTPPTVLTSFTRRAVNNLKRAVSADFKSNCVTIHKLLEYEPHYFEVVDEETGDTRNTMRFEPGRTMYNPLDSSIQTLVIDESSMVSLELEEEVNIAFPHKVQKIYLGDINQLPPVFGSAVLGYRMQELPVIELTQIYRQAANSPIIKYATAIKEGSVFEFKEKHVEQTEDGRITFHPWKKRISGEDAVRTAAAFLKKAIDLGSYDPEDHMVLCPFNKSFGTIELNKHIANHLARKRGVQTHEVIAGFLSHHFSVGDKVMYDKEDAVIISISKNGAYTGTKRYKPASITLDYWGTDQGTEEQLAARKQQQQNEDDIISEEDVEKILSEMAVNVDEARVAAASHIITLRMLDTDQEVVLDTAAEINGMLLGYCLTVHKSQGAEWDKVFVMLHQSHATMLQRELLYTALTRARNEVYVICEPDTFVKGVQSQKIKGNTLAEKAEWFKGRNLKY
jgi:exodeoxyribonuclease V alpha subunit